MKDYHIEDEAGARQTWSLVVWLYTSHPTDLDTRPFHGHSPQNESIRIRLNT